MCDAASVTYDHMMRAHPCLYHRTAPLHLKQDALALPEKQQALKAVFGEFRRLSREPDTTEFCDLMVVALMLIERLLKKGVYIHSTTADR